MVKTFIIMQMQINMFDQDTERGKYFANLFDKVLRTDFINNDFINEAYKSTPNIVFNHSVLFNFFPMFMNNLIILHYMRQIKYICDTNPRCINNTEKIEEYHRTTPLIIVTHGGRKYKKIKKILRKYK